MIVLCAEEYQKSNRSFPGVVVVLAPNVDEEKPLTKKQIGTASNAARIVARAVREKKKVLVTCLAGRNRSGLVTAMALCLLYGVSGKEAVEKVQKERKGALTNKEFVTFLETIPTIRKGERL